MDDFSAYEKLRDQGATAIDAWRQAYENGLDFGARIRMVRKVFDLTLIEAKEVSVMADSGLTLDEHQRALAEELKKALSSDE